MSDFWWKRFPQYSHGYGRVSEWMSRCVDSVLLRLNVFPHCVHENCFSCECTAMCCCSDTSWPKLLLHTSHVYGRRPVCDRRTCTLKITFLSFKPVHSFTHFKTMCRREDLAALDTREQT